jgi:hypothetical protein
MNVEVSTNSVEHGSISDKRNKIAIIIAQYPSLARLYPQSRSSQKPLLKLLEQLWSNLITAIAFHLPKDPFVVIMIQ